jgi:putative colanic acid biosynthesis UDP-glucose lipid carrier transferase
MFSFGVLSYQEEVRRSVTYKKLWLFGDHFNNTFYFHSHARHWEIEGLIYFGYDLIDEVLISTGSLIGIKKKIIGVNEIANIIQDLQRRRKIVSYNEIGEIWIVADLLTNDQIREAINKFSKIPINLHILSSGKILNMNKPLTIYQNYLCYDINISRFYGNALFTKLFFDKIFAIFFLIILSPVLLIGMFFIYLEDKNPIFFIQERTGWDGRRFKVYKLRTLKNNNPEETKQVIENDSRLLNCGSFIRKFSIDEIPQFFNVLKGQMSIVGPRPHMTSHSYKYSKLLNKFLTRHACNPGITGLAQVSGVRGGTINIEDMEQRVKLDIEYLEKWSLWLDVQIIFKTFYAVFKYAKL